MLRNLCLLYQDILLNEFYVQLKKDGVMMNHFLLNWNIRLYAVMYSLSLVLLGSEAQRAAGRPDEIGRGVIVLVILPIMYFVFLKIGKYLRREDRLAKNYVLMGVATLLFAGPFWPYIAVANAPLLFGNHYALVNYARIATAVSVVVTISYFVCAWIAWKAHKEQNVSDL